MEKSDWKLIKEALQEKMIRSNTESVDAQIAIILSEIEGKLVDKPKNNVFSREECVFVYCPHPELCKDKCVNY